MSIKEGDTVEYDFKGQKNVGLVQAILWLGCLKARITPAVKGHPTTWSVKDLKLIKE